jgi:GGDEF domain-containing protein
VTEAASGDDHLLALATLGATRFASATDLFDQGLGLLVRQLGVDRAVMASVYDGHLEILWSAGGGSLAAFPPDPNLNYCSHVLGGPGPALVIGDAEADPAWRRHPAWRELGVRAYVGAQLSGSGGGLGVLSVQCGAGRVWRPAEVALVDAMAALFGRTLEVETLKAGLTQAREVLDLTAAVIEDHALESARTGLPTRRYLEVWCRSHLTLARRRHEVIALATWSMPPGPGREQLLARLAGSLRGVDLLADLGRDRFLLVLPRTPRAGADMVLQRVRATLGIKGMGATLWNPLLNPDRDAPTLQPAIDRARKAEPGDLAPGAPGVDDGEVVWTLLEPSRANILGDSSQW